MAGGYTHEVGGIDGLIQLIRNLQVQIDAIRSSAGIKSSVLRGDKIEFQNNAGNLTALIGVFNGKYYDYGPDNWVSDVMRGFALFKAGTTDPFFSIGHAETANRIDLALGRGGTPLNTFVVGSGYSYISGGGGGFFRIDENGYVTLDGGNPQQRMDNTGIEFTTGGKFGLFGLPTTSSAANLRLDTISGDWTIGLVTSSARYKQDIEPASIDPADVLKLEPRTWRDKNDVAAEGKLVPKDPMAFDGKAGSVETVPFVAPWHVGFIAEDVDALPTLQQFVQHDAEGQPNAIDYDRVPVALLVLAKAQEERLSALEAENVELKATVADLVARVEALEGKQ